MIYCSPKVFFVSVYQIMRSKPLFQFFRARTERPDSCCKAKLPVHARRSCGPTCWHASALGPASHGALVLRKLGQAFGCEDNDYSGTSSGNCEASLGSGFPAPSHGRSFREHGTVLTLISVVLRGLLGLERECRASLETLALQIAHSIVLAIYFRPQSRH